MTDEIYIDDDENADWLHGKPKTEFKIFDGEEELGTANLKTKEIETKDEELREYFDILMDEGPNGNDPISEYDGAAFMEAMKKEGYEAK